VDGEVLRRVLLFCELGDARFQPARSVPAARPPAELYCGSEFASAREHEGNTILTFRSEEEESEWPEEQDALAALIPIRAQIARGDLRSLYIGWLGSAQAGDFEDEELEPPVPPGLGELDGSLERLVDFLRVHTDLVAVAAAASPPLRVQPLTRGAIRKWIAGRSDAERNDYLERFIAAEEPALATELQRLIGEGDAAATPSSERRTAGALLAAAQEAREQRERAEAARAAARRKQREREAAEARSQYLEDLARKEPAVWTEIENLISTKQPASYDRAVGLLVDLRDLATASGDDTRFHEQLRALRVKHDRKPSLLAKIKGAGLG
jgi:hypothetical protein